MSFIKWAETQPAGASNQSWFVGAMSYDGSCILAGAGSNASSGKLYYSSNSGASWSIIDPYGDSSSRSWWWGSISDDGTKIFVGCNSGKLWYSSNSGINCSAVYPDTDRGYSYPWCVMSNDGIKLAVSEYGGKIWYSSNSGSSWSEIRTTAGYNGIAMSGDGTKLFACIWGGRCYYSSNSGSTWSEVKPKGDTNGSWNNVAMSDDGTKLIAVDYYGKVYYSSDSGTNWDNGSNSISAPWYGAAMSDDGTAILTNANGDYPYKATNSVPTWYEQRPAASTGYWQFCCAIAGDKSKWLVGNYGGRLYLGTTTNTSTFYNNTNSSAGGDGTTNDTTGANRAFATLAEALLSLSYAASDSDLEIQCCGTIVDSSKAQISSTYVQSGYTLTIKGNPNHTNGENTGTYDATKYTKVGDSVECEGIRIESASTTQKVLVSKIQLRATAQQLLFYISPACKNIVDLRKTILSIPNGIAIYSYVVWQRSGTTSLLNVSDCVINYEGTGPCNGTGIGFGGGDSSVYNTVIRGFAYGISRDASQTVIAKNCSVFDNTDDFVSMVNSNIDHCASDDGDGTNPITIADWDDQFTNVDYVADSDYRLLSTSDLLNAGVGPGVDADVPTTDIIALVRSGSTSTVGPFEHEYGWSDIIYTKEGVLNLPSDDTDLSTTFTTEEYGDVSADDALYAEQTGYGTYATFLFKDVMETNTGTLSISARAKSSKAPEDSTVYLQVYNQTSATWETLDSNNSAVAETDFTLSGAINTKVEEYYDVSNKVSCRIYQRSLPV